MYKNWSSINEVADKHLQLALALVVTGSKEAERLAIAFPECFSEKEYYGPVLLSVLLDADFEQCEEDPGWYTEDKYLVSHEVIGKDYFFDAPIITFAYNKDDVGDLEAVADVSAIDEENINFGDIVTYKGKKLFVVENNTSGWIECVPAECIKIDCKIPA